MLFVLALLVLPALALADGPRSYPRPEAASESAPPQLAAIDAYNAGYAQIKRADELSADASNSAQAAAGYEQALTHFARAVELDPAMHEAFTYIGYANRKLQRTEQALQAYAEALRINPDYPYAIEYQGQAFIQMGQLERAQFNYLRLYAIAPAQAAKLLAALSDWEEAHRGDQTAELAAWIAERKQIAGAVDLGSADAW